MSDETRPQRLATLRVLADRLDADERPYVAADVRWIVAELAWQDAQIIDLQATIKKLSDELGRREPEEGVDA